MYRGCTWCHMLVVDLYPMVKISRAYIYILYDSLIINLQLKLYEFLTNDSEHLIFKVQSSCRLVICYHCRHYLDWALDLLILPWTGPLFPQALSKTWNNFGIYWEFSNINCLRQLRHMFCLLAWVRVINYKIKNIVIGCDRNCQN